MMSKTNTAHKGFIALIAVILLSLATLAFSLATSAAAMSYADSVSQRELRIQARLNAGACLDMATLMVAKDFFLNGTTTVPEFGCTVSVSNDIATGNVSLNVAAVLEGVTGRGSRTLNVQSNSITVISSAVQ